MTSISEEILGKGRTADVYQYGDNAVIKLLKPGFPEFILDYEEKTHVALQCSGLPIPKLIDKVKKNGRNGLVYQKINGITMIEAFKQHPQNLLKYARDMAALHHEIGSCEANSLPSVKENLYSGINRQTILSKRESEKARQALEGLSTGKAICHRDFHPGNIMIENNKYWVIDWINASSGCFQADIMRTYMILSYALEPNGQLPALLSKTAGFILKKMYLKHLLSISDIDMSEVYSWELPTIAARFYEDVPPPEELALKERFKRILS